MSLTKGTRLGSYEIASPLGEGGMGQVYRARDTKLGRDVAIKVLPANVANDPDRLARFEREARVLGSLNHPNIAAIYGVEDSTAVRGLVLELVDGPTLADQIRNGPMTLSEALAIARQIVEALDAAHEHGIVHRDLKPSNVKVRLDGAVKVLDFGLARLVADRAGEEPASDVTQLPTITSPAVLTNVGIVLGTAAYMSPEQARGEPTDKRSDIWAFGCVLFEMLTGTRAFESHSVAETMASVLARDPDWSLLPPGIPAPIRTLLKRCLARDRRARIGDVAALRFVLEDTANLSDGAVHGRAASRTWTNRRVIQALAIAVIAAGTIGAIAYRLRPQPSLRPFTFSILPPEGTAFVAAALAGAPALSSNGRQIAYVADGPGGRLLWIQSVDAFDARPLPGTEDASCPFWAGDGSWVGFQAADSLKTISLRGGQPQVLGRVTPTGRGCFGGSVNQHGTILFYGGTNNTLASISSSGGQPVNITERNIALFDENHLAPAFLPDGQHYLLQVRGGPNLQFDVWAGQLGSIERRLLLKDVTNARYAPPAGDGPGHVVYARDRTLFAHPFDPATMTLVGSPMAIASNVAMVGSGRLADFTVSANGVLAYRHGTVGTNELMWYDRAGRESVPLGDRAGDGRNNVRVSPDGRSVAFTRIRDGVPDVWIASGDGSVSRFTLDGGRSPAWSPDGSQLAYLRQDTVYRKPLDGGAEVALWTEPGTLAINDWSGDGTYLLLTRWDTSQPGMTGRSLWLLPHPLQASAKHEPVLFQADALHGQFGPRAGAPRWISFDAADAATRQVFVRTLPGVPPGRWQVSDTIGNTSRWRADGGELYFLSAGRMMAAEIDPASSFRVRAVRQLFVPPPPFIPAAGQYAHGWDVSPDGQRFLTTLPPPDTPARAITVVMNWQSALKPTE